MVPLTEIGEHAKIRQEPKTYPGGEHRQASCRFPCRQTHVHDACRHVESIFPGRQWLRTRGMASHIFVKRNHCLPNSPNSPPGHHDVSKCTRFATKEGNAFCKKISSLLRAVLAANPRKPAEFRVCCCGRSALCRVAPGLCDDHGSSSRGICGRKLREESSEWFCGVDMHGRMTGGAPEGSLREPRPNCSCRGTGYSSPSM